MSTLERRPGTPTRLALSGRARDVGFGDETLVVDLEATIAAQRHQVAPDVGRQQHRTGLAAFAEDSHLAPVVTRVRIAPAQAGDLRDAQAGAQHQHAQRGVGCNVEPDVDGDEGLEATVGASRSSSPFLVPAVSCQPRWPGRC